MGGRRVSTGWVGTWRVQRQGALGWGWARVGVRERGGCRRGRAQCCKYYDKAKERRGETGRGRWVDEE